MKLTSGVLLRLTPTPRLTLSSSEGLAVAVVTEATVAAMDVKEADMAVEVLDSEDKAFSDKIY